MKYFVIFGILLVAAHAATAQESGYQVIQGTRVFTQIDHASDTATFSNDCGSQTLTHAELGAGAIPDKIIPCPRGHNSDRGVSCPPGFKPYDSRMCIPVGGSYCEGAPGFYCSAGERCSPNGECISAKRQCPDGKKYCKDGWFCSQQGECIPVESECETKGKYCRRGFKCTSNDKCIPIDAEECSGGGYCDNGKICDQFGEKCVVDTRKNGFVFIVTTSRGDFFGAAANMNRNEAFASALRDCEAQKANSASTTDEKQEICNVQAQNQAHCLMLARSHDLYYGPDAEYSIGVGNGDNRDEAKSDALLECKKAGGKTCSAIPETFVCPPKP